MKREPRSFARKAWRFPRAGRKPQPTSSPVNIFAIAGTRLAVEIFTGDDVGCGLRPALGNLHAFLAEDRGSLFVSDQRGALLPLHHVKRRGLAIREAAFEHQSLTNAGLARPRPAFHRFAI